MIERLAVLMTVHNRKEITQGCLEYLNKSVSFCKDSLWIDIYIVDDGSTDGTPEMIHSLFPSVKLIQGNGDLFWNRGMRLAWIEASKDNYDYYLWLNDDTLIVEDSIDLVIKSYKERGKCIIVGCTHDSKDSQKTTYGGFDAKGNIISPNGKLQQIDTINGNFVLVSKAVYEDCGILPYELHHSGGDNYYSIVAKKNNIPCFLTPCYIGACDNHERPKQYCDPSCSLYQRLSNLYSPLGNPPSEIFFLTKLKKGYICGIINVFLIHCHAIFPSLWNLLRSHKK